jgi:diguanylate cyclase (GGDEF)-like protein
MLPRIRLKYILFITFTLIASMPVLFLAGWVQESALDKEVDSVKEKHLLVAKNLTGDLERYITDVESSLELISDNMINGNKLEGIPKYLDSLYLRYIRITDAEGHILKSVTATSAVEKDRFSPETLEVLKPIIFKARNKVGKVIYSNMVRTGENQTTFYLVKALSSNQFVIAALTTTHILQVQKKISFGRRGHVAIVDRTGRAIAHPVPDWVKTSKDMSFLPPVQKMMQGKTGVSKFFTPAMNADMVAGYTVVPQTGWGVMVPQPFEELQERASDVRFVALMIALIGIAISGFISWYIANIFCNPIQAVVDATNVKADNDSDSPLATNVTAKQRIIPSELRVLLNSFNLMRDNINNLTKQLHSKVVDANEAIKRQNVLLMQQSEVLQENNKKLEILTYTDSLTDLYNRRHFDRALGNEISHAVRYKETFSLMMIDLDNFKNINDEYGHSAGDKVLMAVAKTLSSVTRQSDIPCRVGGEEFAIIFQKANDIHMRTVAEDMRKRIEKLQITTSDETLVVTVSIGVATFHGDADIQFTQDQLYRCADLALYHSKESGRNQATHFEDIRDTLLQDSKLARILPVAQRKTGSD